MMLKKLNELIKNENKKVLQSITHKSELEQLADQLIQETIGDDGLIWLQYKKLIKNFNAQDNPLGKEEAITILCSLLLLATAQRRLFPSRIARSVEGGAIFKKYFEKMELVNQLSVDVYILMKKMQTSRSKFEYERDLLEKLTGAYYDPKFIKSEDERRKSKKSIATEIWDEAEIEGGEANLETVKET